jgi:hypothetical protein
MAAYISHTHLSSIGSARDAKINLANGICEMLCQLPPMVSYHAPPLLT